MCIISADLKKKKKYIKNEVENGGSLRMKLKYRNEYI